MGGAAQKDELVELMAFDVELEHAAGDRHRWRCVCGCAATGGERAAGGAPAAQGRSRGRAAADASADCGGCSSSDAEVLLACARPLQRATKAV